MHLPKVVSCKEGRCDHCKAPHQLHEVQSRECMVCIGWKVPS